MMKKYLLIILIISFAYGNIFSQDSKIKFGKVDIEDLIINSYDKDTSADAIILADIGELHFLYNNTPNQKGFEYEYTRHLRIKIFNKNAYDLANHEIRLKHSATQQEKITKLKAFTFNLENNKIEKSKISISDLMREKFDESTDIAKFTMPGVKEGSVIDIEYTIKSDYLYYLRSWQFQYNIPVVWSEYYVSIPEYFNYNHTFDGFQYLTKNEQSKKTDRFTITWESGRSATVSTTGKNKNNYSKELTPTSNVFHFIAEDVPAFKKEPYMASIDNYLFKVEFEISWTKYPYATFENYAKTWESVNKDLMGRSDFGGILNSANIPNDLVPELIKNIETDEEKTFAIFNYVKNNIRWNEDYHLIPESSLKSVLKNKSGSSAEINMLLVVMLREAAINAHPVIASTRDNGLININQPGYNQFNYTLAYALINQKNYLMDATDPYCYPNFLPEICLNGQARIVSENFTDWIDLNPQFVSKEIIGGSFNIDQDASFIGKMQFKKDNYFALDFRRTLDNYENIDKYIEEYQNKNQNIEISDYHFENIDSLNAPIIANYSIKINDLADKAGEIIIFKPLNIYAEIDNPFKSEERKYPIDYNYPTEYLYVMNYQVPEGYQVDELPESIQIVSPDKSLGFLYKVVQSGNIVQVTCRKSISKTFFLPSEYKDLKSFYDLMISKQSENIVLKKTI